MPPAPSKVSDQFTPVDSTGRSSMVLCTHCRTQKIPRNSLQRKEEHLRSCAAFAISPLSTSLDSNGQNLLDASISARSTRTKPGNLKINQGRERGSYVSSRSVDRSPSTTAIAGGGGGTMALQERVERIIRGETAPKQTEGFQNLPFTPYASTSTYTSYNDTPASENISSLLSSASNSAANPKKRPLEPRSPDRETASATPGAVTTTTTIPAVPTPNATSLQPMAGPQKQSAKRFKNAELYLDEDDFEFLCSAQTAREMRFAAVVERLARLVRLRDTR